ncbi:MAG: hypothetical protein LBP25_03425 [Tannerellaceae bacterium]|jgi:hypothetical protein|nr:hypothetical protein [Tannerellaceae bacterium]
MITDMKKHIFFLCLVAGTAAQAQTGVIGINTENPIGVLHIDGASTPATVNPAAGAVDSLRGTDDVAVTAEGRIGLNFLNPQAGIDLVAGAPGDAIRIQDGT